MYQKNYKANLKNKSINGQRTTLPDFNTLSVLNRWNRLKME